MERKKRSKGRGLESCYVKTIYGTFGVEMRAYGQKLVQFCKHTHTHTHTHTLTHTHTHTRARVSYSSIDICAGFITVSVNKLLHYRAGGLLQYRAVLLHYRAVIT